jgi:hypothetical protein
MNGDIIAGIDNLSLILLSFLFVVEIYGLITGNDAVLAVGLGAIVILYIVRIRNRSHNRDSSSPLISSAPTYDLEAEEIDTLFEHYF